MYLCKEIQINKFLACLMILGKSLGNHEFDNGVNGLAPFIDTLTCPVLAANLILDEVPKLANLTNLKKAVVLEISGTRIGIVGYVTPATKLSTLKNDVEFTDEIEAIQEEVTNLQNEGISIIIALGHSGYYKDQQIAREVEGLDLVIGGHSHSFLWNGTSPDSEDPLGPYPTYVTQPSGRVVPVVQAYAYTKYLGKIHLIFDSEGELVHSNGSPILLDNTIPQDLEILTMLDRYRKGLQDIVSEVVGNTSVLLDSQSCFTKECNMGNLITDAMIDYYASHYKGEHWTDTPIAMLQAGAIRASIAYKETLYNITREDLVTVMPFDGPVATISVNGSILLQMLEHAVANYDEPRSRSFLQFSGLKVVYDYTKPAGKRVVKATARCWACAIPEYFDVEEKQIYKIITPAVIVQGGDGYAMLKDLPSEILPYNELVCALYYVRRNSPLHPAVEGRITIIQDKLHNRSLSTSYSLSILFATLLILLLLA